MHVLKAYLFLVSMIMLTACGASVPGAVEVDIDNPQFPASRPEAVNDLEESVVYVTLGEDILRPVPMDEGHLPTDVIGPYELRNETVSAALQLILADFEVPLAFETDDAMTRTVTVSNLKGPADKVVDRICSLADLYCDFEDGMLVVKQTQTFFVSLPPIGEDAYDDFKAGLDAVTGGDAIIDRTTRALVYDATHRTNRRAIEYFNRLRGNTALIIYETQIWEVILENNNNAGVDWTEFSETIGNFDLDLISNRNLDIPDSVGFGAQYSVGSLAFDAVAQFLATQGAVKTISQPQITVLSGSDASIRSGTTQSYVSEITRSEGFDDDDDISVTTSQLETGLRLTISSAWDDSTVYGNLEIELDSLVNLENFSVGGTSIQLPEVNERLLDTRIRVRPGDALIIGGIVSERDDYRREGLGLKSPLLPTRRSTQARNSELVFMLRPKVIVFADEESPTTAPDVHPSSRIDDRRSSQDTQEAGQSVKDSPDDPIPLSDYLDQLPMDLIDPTPPSEQ